MATTTLKARYGFNGNANDTSGNNNNATTTSLTYDFGKFGQAGKFNGTTTYASATSTPSLNFASELTISAWIRYDAQKNSNPTIVSKSKTGTAWGQLAYVLGAYQNKVRYGTDGAAFISTTTLQNGKWYNLVMSAKDNQNYLYINGNLDSSYTRTFKSTSSQPIVIGARKYATTTNSYFTGLIDEVAIYNKSLTANEIALLFAQGQSQIVYHHADHLSGSNVETDVQGNILEVMDYFPFGSVRLDQKTSNYSNSYKYTGKELDADTGLYYYGARYYSSDFGRFISQDPWDGNLLDPQTLNKYSYVRNNPIMYNDPTGQCLEDACIGEFLLFTLIGGMISAQEFGAGVGYYMEGDNKAAEQSFENEQIALAGTILVGGATLNEINKTSESTPATKIKVDSSSKAAAEAKPTLKPEIKVEQAAKKVDANAATNNPEKTYQTYTKTNDKTGEVYVGRTSGKSDPKTNVQNRDYNHPYTEKGYGEAKIDRSSSDYNAIRGREQNGIDYYRNQGNSGNVYNGISPNNPNQTKYLNSSQNEFGGFCSN